jgi:NAD(P)-dependent dehydrogenase (short-subunit alcohol dehydrogenase family)
MIMKTVLITGGNSGIGKATAQALAFRGYRVFIAARDMKKSEQALADISAAVPGAQVLAMHLDLGDLDQVRAFAEDFRKRVPVLDVLLLNAGLFPTGKQFTAQGFEQQFGVNHLGHFLLTNLLLDSVKAAPEGRIVVVSSIMHWLGRINFGSFRGEKFYNPIVAYGQSKLANVLFAQELSRRLKGTKVTVNALHPGGVDTGIARDLPAFARKIYAMTTVTPEKGAESSIFLASSPEASAFNGQFIRNCKPARVSPVARQATAERLWAVSEELAGCKY